MASGKQCLADVASVGEEMLLVAGATLFEMMVGITLAGVMEMV